MAGAVKSGDGGASLPIAGRGTGPARIHSRAHPIDYLFLLRPMILIPVWTFFLLGAHHGATAAGDGIDAVRCLAGLLSFTALLGAIYIVNQIADRTTDLEAGKLFLLSHGIITPRAAWIETAALAALSFAAAIALLPLPFTAILAASLALGAAYSLEPARLKRRPALDVLANAVGNGILNTLAGWTAIGAPVDRWEILIPYPLAVASVHLATTFADIEADAKLGFRTSGVALGVSRGIVCSTALMGGAAAAAYLVGNGPALAASLLSLPFFLIPGGPAAEDMRRGFLLPVKAATLIFSAAAGFLFPAYIPALAAIVLLTRLYYARRFGITYPSLRGA